MKFVIHTNNNKALDTCVFGLGRALLHTLTHTHTVTVVVVVHIRTFCFGVDASRLHAKNLRSVHFLIVCLMASVKLELKFMGFSVCLLMMIYSFILKIVDLSSLQKTTIVI